MLDLEVGNFTGQPITDFDLMFNKNPFGLSIVNASSGFTYP